MKDLNKTRLDLTAVTSWKADRDVWSGKDQGRTEFTIKVTIGSCPEKLSYKTEQERDEELASIDAFRGIVHLPCGS